MAGQNPRYIKPRRPRSKLVIAAPIAVFRALYLDGLSTRQIAAETGWSYTYVGRFVRAIARDRSAAAQLRQPMQVSQHWRTCRQQARTIMERELGRTLDRLEHVHHIDGDYTNNQRENLEVLWARDHMHTHRPPNPVPRHARPARRAYMKTYLAAYYQAHKANGTES